MKPYAITDKFIFVHAGLDFSIQNPLDNTEAMLWLIDWYKNINYKWLKNRIIIHGHQSISCEQIENQLKNINSLQVINIDNDCVSKNKKGFGSLCCLELTEMKLIFQENVD